MSAFHRGRLAVPANRSRRRASMLGDGDVCPTDTTHGRMFVMPQVNGRPATQRCPHVAHDGRRDAVQTRASWPADVTPEQLATLAVAP